jgi:hypothetical protein
MGPADAEYSSIRYAKIYPKCMHNGMFIRSSRQQEEEGYFSGFRFYIVA